ncbi:MAG: virulence factor [Hyphomicrobiaceae bacterium]
MFAIAFDLTVAETGKRHPKGVTAAYADIAATLERFAFRGIQGSVYVCDNEDMANLFQAISALKELPWFPASVRDLRAFRIEQWSDFTPMMKRP